MMHSIVFIAAARFELLDAADWYENERPGLGERFLLDVDAVTERIARNPWQFPIVHAEVRRALLTKFPYALMYFIEDGADVSILSCFHSSRNPMRWRERM